MIIKVYHVTDKKSCDEILEKGFRFTGDNTAQMGEGIYFTDWDELYFWADHLNKWHVLEVEIEYDNFSNPKTFDMDNCVEWCVKEGYFTEDRRPTEKALSLVDYEHLVDIELEGKLMNLYCRNKGYNGMNGINQLIVFGASKIKNIRYHSKIDSNFSIDKYNDGDLLKEVIL